MVSIEEIERIIQAYPQDRRHALAVMQDMHGSCVWVVKADRTVERRYIVRDVTEGDVQFVASGLKAGETIVADGIHKVTKRSVIEPVK